MAAAGYEFFLEHHPIEAFNANLDRWKRLKRQGWSVTVLYAYDGSEIVALGCREAGARWSTEPDRAGQYELEV